MSSMIAIIFILNKLLVKYFTRFKQKAIIAGLKFLHAKAGDKKQDPWRVGVVCFSLTSTPFLRVGIRYMFGQQVLVESKKSFQKKTQEATWGDSPMWYTHIFWKLRIASKFYVCMILNVKEKIAFNDISTNGPWMYLKVSGM